MTTAAITTTAARPIPGTSDGTRLIVVPNRRFSSVLDHAAFHLDPTTVGFTGSSTEIGNRPLISDQGRVDGE
jgi:hypothetical protein